MTSNTKEAYVWIWLQHQDDPIVCGRLKWSNAQLRFNYGQSYLSRKDAIPIYGPELPLKTGEQALLPRMDMPSCIRDGSPDAWGRRVFILQHNIYGVFNITPYNNCFIRSLFIYSV